MYFVYKNQKYKTWKKLKDAIKKNPSYSPAYCMNGGFKRTLHTKPKSSALNFVD